MNTITHTSTNDNVTIVNTDIGEIFYIVNEDLFGYVVYDSPVFSGFTRIARCATYEGAMSFIINY